MPEGLAYLLCSLAAGLVAVLLMRWAYHRGYRQGEADADESNERIDAILRDHLSPPAP